jgi:hypothetical protein
VIIDGAEQSPIHPGRPFALVDHARAPRVELEDVGSQARVVAEHRGYARLPARVRHRRQVTLRRDLDALVVEDALSGRGRASVEVRWHLRAPARRGVPEWVRVRLDALVRHLGPLDLDRAIVLGEACGIVLVGNFPEPTEIDVIESVFSPGYGRVEPLTLVSYRTRPTLPRILKTVFLRLESLSGQWTWKA